MPYNSLLGVITLGMKQNMKDQKTTSVKASGLKDHICCGLRYLGLGSIIPHWDPSQSQARSMMPYNSIVGLK